jgi:hypothetical protein
LFEQTYGGRKSRSLDHFGSGFKYLFLQTLLWLL